MSCDSTKLGRQHADVSESRPGEKGKQSICHRRISTLKRLRKSDRPLKPLYSLENAHDSRRTKRQNNYRQTLSMSDFA